PMIHPAPEQLERFLDEKLSARERDALEDHVNHCDHCLEHLDSLQRKGSADLRLLAGLLVSPPPANQPRESQKGRGACAAWNNDDEARECPDGKSDTSEWPVFAGYELVACVSSGGMGEIYRARQRTTGRTVALKTLPASGAHAGPEYEERRIRFQTEIDAVIRLQHPNIVAIYDVGEQDGRPYYTMEWIGGGSLADKLAGKP